MKPFAPLLALMGLLVLPTLPAGGQAPPARADFELAQEAVARGEILPLAQVLDRLQAVHPGRVIEVELEYSEGRRIYEVELATQDGRLIEVELDAVTGTILEVEDE